jgi:DHA2 family multidrug resistance protein
MEEVVWMTVLSGYGMGMMWVTLATVTFSTLSPALRVEAASLFALVRAIGASMGTSIIVAILVRSSQVSYIELRRFINPMSERLTSGLGGSIDPGSTAGLLELYRLVLSQAEMIGFLNGFVFLTAVVLFAAPLVFLLRRPPKSA